MIEHIITNYSDNLKAIGFSAFGILAILAMFLPKNNPFSELINWMKRK